MVCAIPTVNNMIRAYAKGRAIQHVREMNAIRHALNMCRAMRIAPTMILLHAAKGAIAEMAAESVRLFTGILRQPLRVVSPHLIQMKTILALA